MTTAIPWDVIIVGGGIIGSWTGYHLVKSGQKVLILDQFHLPHTRGSSHGHSRTIRKAMYHKEPLGVMIPESYDIWMKLQHETDVQFFKQTGMLFIEDNSQTMNKMLSDELDKNNIQHEALNADQLQMKYPMFKFSQHHNAIFDPTPGQVNPVKVQKILHKTILCGGGTIHDAEKVTQIYPSSVTTLITNKNMYHAKSVILTPGPWADDVMKLVGLHVPVKSMAGWPAYWAVTGQYEMKASQGLPIIKYSMDTSGNYFWLMPEWEYPGMVKILTRGSFVPKNLHPDRQARDEDQNNIMTSMKETVSNYINGVEDHPALVEPCMYTFTPDGAFIIDKHPHYDNVIFGVGFSGIGFIAAPVVGKLLAEMATNEPLSYDISGLGMNRFSKGFSRSTSKL